MLCFSELNSSTELTTSFGSDTTTPKSIATSPPTPLTISRTTQVTPSDFSSDDSSEESSSIMVTIHPKPVESSVASENVWLFPPPDQDPFYIQGANAAVCHSTPKQNALDSSLRTSTTLVAIEEGETEPLESLTTDILRLSEGETANATVCCSTPNPKALEIEEDIEEVNDVDPPKTLEPTPPINKLRSYKKKTEEAAEMTPTSHSPTRKVHHRKSKIPVKKK